MIMLQENLNIRIKKYIYIITKNVVADVLAKNALLVVEPLVVVDALIAPN